VTRPNNKPRKPVLYGPDNKPLPTKAEVVLSKGSKLHKQQKPQQKAQKTETRVSPLAILLVLATLSGGAAAVVTFVPRVTVNASDPVNQDDPFSSSITITNTGYMPLVSVTPKMGLGGVVYSREANPPAEPPDQKFDYSTWLQRPEWGPHDMGLDDKITIALNELLNIQGAPIAWADIAVAVEYEIPIIHLKRQKVFHLTTKRQTNGHLYWYSKLMD
jgi:hypothetical protein